MSFSSQDIKAISSRQNPLVDELRALRDDTPEQLLFLEGPKLLEEALKSNLAIEQLAFVPALLENEAIQAACALAKKKIQITPYVLKGLSDVEAPQGVIAIARKPKTDWPKLLSRSPKPIVILDGIQNAGNAATIVRTAEAAGAAGVVTTSTTAKLFSPKALRGAMGSSLRLPILEHQTIPVIKEKLASAGYNALLTSAATQKATVYTDIDWPRAWAIVLGQEGNGLSEEWGENVQALYIPMEATVESLNVAAAAAVVLYEARRQMEKK